MEGYRALLVSKIVNISRGNRLKTTGGLQGRLSLSSFWVLPNWVPGTGGDLVVKGKLSPHSCSVDLRQLNPHNKRGL